MTRVVAPSRLHFGLLSLAGPALSHCPGVDGGAGMPIRQFGGVGMMVDRPGVAVQVVPAKHWSATGPLSDRAMGFAQRMAARIGYDKRTAFRVAVEHAPREHTGLGVGTQLGLAVAKAIAVESGHAEWSAIELAARIGRGERSAIGVHGFDRGGLIVDGGKLPNEAVSPLAGRFDVPANWAVLLFTPPGATDWHGGRERDALARLTIDGNETAALCRLVLTGLLPALASMDIDLFGEALHEFNARAGDVFAPVQGGRYALPAVADCVASLRSLGVRGVGQSSWGPTVFALVHREDASRILAEMTDAPGLIAGASAGAVVN